MPTNDPADEPTTEESDTPEGVEESAVQAPDRRPPRVAAPSPTRRRVLEPLALQAAQAWVEWQCQVLSDAGRARAGGWPGTLREARRWVHMALTSRGAPATAATADEVTWLAETTYAAARQRWLVSAVPDEG